ncbi:hypothetical protein ARMGADRAFT_1038592 [Armillaria gallica]|uniref:Uncharacterized protein n=1 Tax=Armillaria gallica TaxID=47427 RepID=A0A2H3D4K5_ARMGA|nr:hypothetical protein ARMGADRAFT_1038592 [Armillaria gallica]
MTLRKGKHQAEYVRARTAYILEEQNEELIEFKRKLQGIKDVWPTRPSSALKERLLSDFMTDTAEVGHCEHGRYESENQSLSQVAHQMKIYNMIQDIDLISKGVCYQ